MTIHGFDNSSKPIWELLTRHIGEARLYTFVEMAKGDFDLAVALYRFNDAVSSAFWESFALFEVSLRHSLDTALTERITRLGIEASWTDDPRFEFGRSMVPGTRHGRPFADIVRTRERIIASQRVPTHNRIVSELTFGFWHQILSARFNFVWPDLRRKFPFLPDRTPGDLRSGLGSLRDVRNRIGHHHQILTHQIDVKFEQLLRIAGYMSPDLRDYLESTSRLPEVINRDPRRHGKPRQLP